MAGGGDHPGANKREREEAGRPKAPSKRAKGKEPYEAPALRGGGGGSEEMPQPVTAMDKRVAAEEEMSESRRPSYYLKKELTVLCEKMRCNGVSMEDRSKLVTEALRKMDGKYLEMARFPVTACVLQLCMKWCSPSERNAVFVALQPHFLDLSRDKYTGFLVINIIKRGEATKNQCALFISSLHGHVASLLRHTVGAAVVDHAFDQATRPQKRSLLLELYSTELQLSKDLKEEKRAGSDKLLGVARLLTKSKAKKKISKAKKKRSSEPCLIRIMQTKEGLKLGLACLKHGLEKNRKTIIKSLKGQILKLALSDYGCLFVICLLSIVDNIQLVTEVVVDELTKHLKELIFHKNGRRPLLQLFHPLC